MPSLEERVAAVEAEVVRLKQERHPLTAEEPWWKKIVGVFQDNPEFEEAMRLGREYRESDRPEDDEADGDSR